MRKPAVDFRHFRLSKLNTPEFSHMRLGILGWLFYFSMYFITENLIPAEACTPMHAALDDLIPFCEYFVIPYVFWYALVFFSLIYYLVYDPPGFRKLETFILITQVVAMACYVLFPSRQDLRPTEFERDNFFTHAVAFLYSFDTNTGVCPSLHVAYSLGLVSVWLRDKTAHKAWKAFVVFIVIVICCSTAFIKQHSVVDIYAALPLGLLAELLVYGRDWWWPRLKRLFGKQDAETAG